MENRKENLTVQGVINPVPAALVGVQAGPQASKSYYRNTSPVANLAGGVDNATSSFETEYTNAFGNSSKIMRTPPPSGKCGLTQPMKEVTNSERRHLTLLQTEEEKAFIELGNKLSAINAVASNAKNIHKPIRDNLVCVMALYQQLRECRDAINSNPLNKEEGIKNVQCDTKCVQTDPIRSGWSNNKDKQTNTTTHILGKQTLTPTGKRLLSASPKCDQVPKRQKTTLESVTVDPNEDVENPWQRVERGKKKKYLNAKQRNRKDIGEAITIKAKDSTTYAEMLKQMKSNINPSELGIEINEMRRTKTGELLIKLKRGEGQAEKLKQVITNTLSDDVTIRSAVKHVTVDIRDMDESTEEHEILKALVESSGAQNTDFKILNVRESYGKTKQALVKMPVNVATKLLKESRIKIGWVRCRIREKEKASICFRCLDQGHLAKNCTGPDRHDLCQRCCKTGHKLKDCNEEKNCILCSEAGLNKTKHFIGSSFCAANRRKQQNKND